MQNNLQNLTEHHTMKAYWGSESIDPLILWPRHYDDTFFRKLVVFDLSFMCEAGTVSDRYEPKLNSSNNF
jgi:hypothetical protein